MEENNNFGAEINLNENLNGGVNAGYNENANGINVGANNTAANLPTKIGIWTKIKNFLFQEIDVELTPKQQKVEKEINDFLHQEVTFKGLHDLLFKEISFGSKK